MIAYNSSGLDNRHARHEAEEAETENILSAEEHSAIRNAYPDFFYTATFFARVGFFILTLICLGFSAGIFAALAEFGSGGGQAGLAVQMLLMAVFCFAALEWLIRIKKHLASGVDDALLYSGFSFTIGAFYVMVGHIPPVMQSMLFLIPAAICVVRYADRMMALIAFFALLCFVFFSGLRTGPLGKALMPFILMGVSAMTYFLIEASIKKNALRFYRAVFQVLSVASLVCFFAAGNYFVVREANHAMSENSFVPSVEIPLAWLFWIFTAGIPVGYIYFGLKTRNRILLVTGLVLVAATAMTIRYYYHFLPPEWAMLIGGSLLLVLSLGAMRLLKTARYGLTAARNGKDPFAGFAQVEALIIDETFSPAAAAPAPNVVFGGGSGGGGGAGGQF